MQVMALHMTATHLTQGEAGFELTELSRVHTTVFEL